MAYTGDLKSPGGNSLRVRIPPRALNVLDIELYISWFRTLVRYVSGTENFKKMSMRLCIHHLKAVVLGV